MKRKEHKSNWQENIYFVSFSLLLLYIKWEKKNMMKNIKYTSPSPTVTRIIKKIFKKKTFYTHKYIKILFSWNRCIYISYFFVSNTFYFLFNSESKAANRTHRKISFFINIPKNVEQKQQQKKNIFMKIQHTMKNENKIGVDSIHFHFYCVVSYIICFIFFLLVHLLLFSPF